MNIPTIEELVKIGEAAAEHYDVTQTARLAATIAIRDAVVAACRPQLRPIAEMPEDVPEGYVRVTAYMKDGAWYVGNLKVVNDTHFIDIALPEPTYPANFEQAFAESKLDAKDKDAAFKLWKGGVR